MTDKFMSGWGRTKNKKNKYVVECDTHEQAVTIQKNAKKRSEMKYINIHSKKPSYNKSSYLVTSKKYSQLGNIWKRK